MPMLLSVWQAVLSPSPRQEWIIKCYGRVYTFSCLRLHPPNHGFVQYHHALAALCNSQPAASGISARAQAGGARWD